MRQSRLIFPVLGLAALLPAARLGATEQTRSFQQSFPVVAGTTVRFANLAGNVELVPSRGGNFVIEAQVHAEGRNATETQKLLNGMKWVKSKDKKGNDEWALSYPVNEFRAFHFPRPDSDGDDLPSFLSFLDVSQTNATYRGERVRIYARKRAGVPTLYTHLRVTMPAGSSLLIRNVVGAARGGDLEGALTVDTGSGDVRLNSFTGNLLVDTGSGDVRLGSVKGETNVDTGSGNIGIGRLVGNGSFDTGSGDVKVENVAAGKLAVDTGSGDVVIREGRASRISADTGSGNVQVVRLEVEDLDADTGSGNVTVQSSLAGSKRISIETGSGDVRILAGPAASFDIASDQGSGDLTVGYADATLRKDGHKVVGARRGDGRTEIRVETGSGDCTITPQAK